MHNVGKENTSEDYKIAHNIRGLFFSLLKWSIMKRGLFGSLKIESEVITLCSNLDPKLNFSKRHCTCFNYA